MIKAATQRLSHTVMIYPESYPASRSIKASVLELQGFRTCKLFIYLSVDPWESFISVISARFFKHAGAFLEATFQVKSKSCLTKTKKRDV